LFLEEKQEVSNGEDNKTSFLGNARWVGCSDIGRLVGWQKPTVGTGFCREIHRD
jgi:hypothetical protein